MIKCYLFVLLGFITAAGSSQGKKSGETLLLNSISAMGGEEKLRGIYSLSLQGIGHSYFLEQSERPEGPWFANYEQVSQLRDYRRNRVYVEKEQKNILQPGWQKTRSIYADSTLALKNGENQLIPGRRAQEGEMLEILEYAPEQLLLAALEAEDLQTAADTVIQGVNHHSVKYTRQGTRINIFLNSQTSLPTLVQSFRSYPQDVMWSVWGEVRNDLYLSAWTLTDHLLYPLQYNLYRNGQPFREFTIVDLKLNEPFDEAVFSLPEDLKKAYAGQPAFPIKALPLGRPGVEPMELVPGIVLISGFWNVTLVVQEEGIFLIEAPISDEYTSQAMEKAGSLFPSKKLKGVVSTADAWPHIGGMGAVLQQQLPVFTHQLNEPLLKRLLASRKGNTRETRLTGFEIKPVKAKMKIGEGRNRFEIYPVEGESSERMIMLYFPEHKLLYASDLVQRNRDGSFFQKAYLKELVAAIEKNQLQVEEVFAMHSERIAFREILEALK